MPEHLIDLWLGILQVIHQVVHIHLNPLGLAYHILRDLDDLECLQSQEVHLHQPDRLHGSPLKLHCHSATILRFEERGIVVKSLFANDESARMLPYGLQHAVDIDGIVKELPLQSVRVLVELTAGVHLCFVFVILLGIEYFLEAGNLEGLERFLHWSGNIGGDLSGANHIVHCALHPQTVECGNASYAIGSVEISHILNDLCPPIILKVDIDIGQRNTVWIQETLK